MSNYRRSLEAGGLYFFTVVTYKRRPFLTGDVARAILKEAFTEVLSERPFTMPACCLLPDHLHCIWRMPDGDCDYSTRWALIKRRFSQAYTAVDGPVPGQSASRRKERELGIWQRRFWEHRIRDERDYANHVHYIHYNPVKHGWVQRVEDWPFSTYHRFRQRGAYEAFDWSPFRNPEAMEGMAWME